MMEALVVGQVVMMVEVAGVEDGVDGLGVSSFLVFLHFLVFCKIRKKRGPTGTTTGERIDKHIDISQYSSNC
jgi:hypothetical protein